jgi:adenylosuccinate synthase
MNVVVIGAQWGDEGKGKIVDYLAGEAQIIVRFSGGANAGHTIVAEDTTYKLHLVPSGIVSPDKTAVLGIGMVIDPEALFQELEMLSEQGVAWQGRVWVSERAHVVLPRYKEEDKEMDAQRPRPIGTTGRGIGITYALKAHREGIRVVDMFDDALVNDLAPQDREFVLAYRPRLEPMTVNTPRYLHNHRNEHVLFEGAQGALLDLDLGTYPYVSSGNSGSSGAALGGGIGPRAVDSVLGVFKAYSTRVGNGPFPSEFTSERDGDLEQTIRELGREYGVTTGRPRRCGYLDLVALRYACITNSIDSLVLTHLDVYDHLDEIKVCTAYRCNDDVIRDFPASITVLNSVEPVTETFPGWKTSIRGVRTYDDLPAKARDYIRFIESFTETPIHIISVGYDRSETITRRDVWTPF